MKKFTKVSIVTFLLFYSVAAYSAWQTVAWEFFKSLLIDTAVEVVQSFVEGAISENELSKLQTKVSTLESRLSTFQAEYGNTSEFLSIHKTVLRLSKLLSSIDTRVTSLENKMVLLEERIKLLENDVPYVKRQITEYSGVSYSSFDANRTVNLNGEWKLVDTVETGKYKGLKIGFRMFFSQNGNSFFAEGEKLWENNRKIPHSQRSSLSITGMINGNVVRGVFKEKGSRRETSGEFIWTVQTKYTLVGHFISTSNSIGASKVIKQ